MENMGITARPVLFGNIYNGKTVLLTGDTGFKGSWLSVWLKQLGADVIGYSSSLPSKPCNFKVCHIDRSITHIKGDVRNFDCLKKVFQRFRPVFVFHLAAQPIVSRAYHGPRETFETNVMGTVNVLECIRSFPGVKAGVFITSDKCYKNMEWHWGYREDDVLGGDEPYSASKACAELVCAAYSKSYLGDEHNGSRIATARAGNVIGGGDWAIDRIIPDCVRAWTQKKTLYIRNPRATRPWQHVLEPLSGYLSLGERLYKSSTLHGQSFNFGPNNRESESVDDLIRIFSQHFTRGKWQHKRVFRKHRENRFLEVACDKALHYLKWQSIFSLNDTVKITAEWYKEYYMHRNPHMFDYMVGQIDYYVARAAQHDLGWIKELS
jgi:CDP-glucose 4,6-dehydratase